MKTENQIRILIQTAINANSKPGSYAFLPEIIASLEKMQNSLNEDSDRRRKMAGALGRLVTEDWNFSESDLGQQLLDLVNEYGK